MKIKATKNEINECFRRAFNRVIKESVELVGTEDEEEDAPEIIDEPNHDEDFGDVNQSNMGDIDTAGEVDPENDEMSDYIEGEKPDEYSEVNAVDMFTDIDPNETDLIAKLEEVFGESTTDVNTGNVMFTIPADAVEEFRNMCAEEDIECEGGENMLQENTIPCEPFKVTTTGKVFWMRESKAVENVDTFKFRMNESYRKQCWNNFKNGKFVM